MPPVQVDGLTRVVGDVAVLDDVSFAVPEGGVVGVLGAEGAGKTTLLSVLLGLRRPTTGEAELCGADVTDRAAHERARADVGYLPASLGVDPAVTGADFLDYHGALRGDDRREELVEAFDPPLEEPMSDLSAHDRRAIGFVQAFMHDPDVVLLDEPTAALDPLRRAAAAEFLREEADRGVAILVATAELGLVRQVADRVVVMREGRVLAVEPRAEFLDNGAKQVRLQAEESLSAMDLNLLGVVDLVMTRAGAQFTFLGDYRMLAGHLSDLPLVDVTVEEPPLDTVIEHYYGTGGSPGTPGDEGGDGPTVAPADPRDIGAAAQDPSRPADESRSVNDHASTEGPHRTEWGVGPGAGDAGDGDEPRDPDGDDARRSEADDGSGSAGPVDYPLEDHDDE